MDLSAAHTGFVVGSYALSAIFLLGLTIYVIFNDRKLRAEAERLGRQRHRGDA